MIVNKTTTTENIIEEKRPIGYEYDSNSTSVVLLDGYKYEIFYTNSKIKDTIDLTKD